MVRAKKNSVVIQVRQGKISNSMSLDGLSHGEVVALVRLLFERLEVSKDDVGLRLFKPSDFKISGQFRQVSFSRDEYRVSDSISKRVQVLKALLREEL